MDWRRRWWAFRVLRGKNPALAVGFFLKPLFQAAARPFAPFLQHFQLNVPQ